MRLGFYQHYKGNKYKVLGIARHSETLEEMVVYHHVDDGKIWIRPLQMFVETVMHEGKKMRRFAFVGD